MTEERTPNTPASCPNSVRAIAAMKTAKFSPNVPTMKIASITAVVFAEAVKSPEPALVAFGIGTATITVLSGWLTGILAKAVVDEARR